MDIAPGIGIVSTALHIRDAGVLIASDFHVGYEEALNKEGVLVPRVHSAGLLAGLKAVFGETGPVETFIINGDLKHEFATISHQEWKCAQELLALIKANCRKVVLVQGNHDAVLGPIADTEGVSVVKHYYLARQRILIAHGHEIPAASLLKESSVIIIGHEHPAVSLRDGARVERFKCFLSGSWRGKRLIVMPSASSITEGTDVLGEGLLSPFLKGSIRDFHVFVIADTVYDFGTVHDLRNTEILIK